MWPCQTHLPLPLPLPAGPGMSCGEGVLWWITPSCLTGHSSACLWQWLLVWRLWGHCVCLQSTFCTLEVQGYLQLPVLSWWRSWACSLSYLLFLWVIKASVRSKAEHWNWRAAVISRMLRSGSLSQGRHMFMSLIVVNIFVLFEEITRSQEYFERLVVRWQRCCQGERTWSGSEVGL